MAAWIPLQIKERKVMKLIAQSHDIRIQKVLQIIKTDPSARISDLASQVNLSSSRLSHLFKEQIGFSLNVFLANERLEKAADLLQNTEMRIKEITYCVGYCQETSFDRAFKRRFDHSPRSYRKLLRATDSVETQDSRH